MHVYQNVEILCYAICKEAKLNHKSFYFLPPHDVEFTFVLLVAKCHETHNQSSCCQRINKPELQRQHAKACFLDMSSEHGHTFFARTAVCENFLAGSTCFDPKGHISLGYWAPLGKFLGIFGPLRLFLVPSSNHRKIQKIHSRGLKKIDKKKETN